MYTKFVIYILVVFATDKALSKIIHSPNDIKIDHNKGTSGWSIEKCLRSNGTLSDLRECTSDHILNIFQKVNSQKHIEIFPGISFTRESNDGIDDSNGRNVSEKISDAVTDFFQSRTLQIKLPMLDSDNMARSFDEGRAKMKKMMNSAIVGMGVKLLAVIPILLTTVTLLASKALIIGKLAFVVAVIFFMQNMFGTKNPGYGPLYGYDYNNNNNANYYGGNYRKNSDTNISSGPYSRSLSQ